MRPLYTTQAQVRRSFWEQEGLNRRRALTYQRRTGDFHCDVRVMFCDYIDWLAKDGRITESLAQRTTLR